MIHFLKHKSDLVTTLLVSHFMLTLLHPSPLTFSQVIAVKNAIMVDCGQDFSYRRSIARWSTFLNQKIWFDDNVTSFLHMHTSPPFALKIHIISCDELPIMDDCEQGFSFESYFRATINLVFSEDGMRKATQYMMTNHNLYLSH